jgi:hypothetical protein
MHEINSTQKITNMSKNMIKIKLKLINESKDVSISPLKIVLGYDVSIFGLQGSNIQNTEIIFPMQSKTVNFLFFPLKKYDMAIIKVEIINESKDVSISPLKIVLDYCDSVSEFKESIVNNIEQISPNQSQTLYFKFLNPEKRELPESQIKSLRNENTEIEHVNKKNKFKIIGFSTTKKTGFGITKITKEENIEKDRLEAERLKRERLEAERLYREKLKAERLERERIKRLNKERIERERLEAERLYREKLKAERLERERIKAEKLEAERIEKERLEAERIEKERLEAERIEKERLEAERIEKERTIICPKCHYFSVKYISHKKDWYCTRCKINPYRYKRNLDFTDSEKYKIYKLWGIEALAKLLGQYRGEVENFVARYFEKCCLSKGDKCIYHTQIKDVKTKSSWKKELEKIELLFENIKSMYNILSKNIDELWGIIETKSSILNKEDLDDIKNEYFFFKETTEQISSQLDDYIVALATEDLEVNKKVFVNDSEEQLLASSSFKNGIEGFTWNDAKKEGLVGVFPFSLEYCIELMVLYYTEFVGKVNSNPSKHILSQSEKQDLSSIEKNALEIISSEDGVYQNELWKQLSIDSRKCSRIVKSLLDKKLINREQAVSNGARTYLLKSKVHFKE